MHDTYGFPLELTQEIASERNVEVDVAGFDIEMSAQRTRAKSARKGAQTVDDQLLVYREILDKNGLTKFVGYLQDSCSAKVLAIVDAEDSELEIF